MKKEKYSWISNDDLDLFKKMHEQKKNDWHNNLIHLSSYSGLINDPNGLIKIKDTYYIFMQNVPFSDKHMNKSWLLYTTKDFISYIYEGIALTPSNKYDNHGVFSGGAYRDKNGEISFFYTGNLKDENNKRMSNTLSAKIDFDNKVVIKELLFKTDLKRYSGEFRDPNIVKKNNNVYMLNGAQDNNKRGVLSVYKLINNNWEFHKDIYLDDNEVEKCFMVECPNYLKIDEKEFIISCLEQDKPLKDGGHFVEFREWKVDDEFNIEFNSNLQKLDYGYDFYAPQIFQETGSRTIMLGWLGNSRSNHEFTPEKSWSNQLTIPRELTLVNGILHQNPVAELNNLNLQKLSFVNGICKYKNGICKLNIQNVKQKDFFIKIKSNNGYINILKNDETLIIDRSNMDFVDEKNLPNELIFSQEKIESLEIIIDRSCLEIFINQGKYVISYRYFLENHDTIETNILDIKAIQLKPLNFEWNNLIYKNITK